MENAVVVGEGPAVEAIASGLGDTDIAVDRRAEDDLDVADLEAASVGLVVDRVGAERFHTFDAVAREVSTPWIAVELGGVGGYPVVEASVAGFDPDRECYDCLAGRVAANAEPEAEPLGPPGSPTARLAGAIAARTVAEWLDDGGQDRGRTNPLGRVIEIPSAERRFLPLPNCDCADDPDRSLDLTDADRDLDETIARAEQGLDDRVGIVAQLGEVESYPAPYYLAQLCDTSGFSDASAPRQAAGVAVGWNEAFMKALGESFERYAAGVYRRDEFTRSTRLDLDVAVSPSSFVRPADADVDAETELDWLPAENLASGAETYVPASLVVHPPANRPIRPAITTGLGLGSSGVDALLSGLYETIERDATMLAWYSTYEPLELDVADDEYQALAARARAEGLTVTPLLVTQDVDVPVIAVVVQDDGGEFPQAAAGSAAHLDPERAARGALAEAVQNWMELQTMGPDGAAEAGGAIGDYATDPSPLEPWLAADGPVPADSVGPDTVPTGEDELEAVVERLRDAGLTSYGVRTTPRDLAAIGFEAVRVLVPAAQPLFLGDPFFGERATAVPESLGFEPRPDREHHPFP